MPGKYIVMDVINPPKLPSNPQDGDQISDNLGNVYEYHTKNNCWVRIGILEAPPTVSLQSDGLVTPDIFNKIKQIESLIEQGIDFDKTKIFVGNRPDNPYFYFFHSTDDLIKFQPETLITGQQRLRIEVDRGRLLQKLTRTPCIGPRGLPGPIGDPGKDGKPADNEKFVNPKSLTPDSLEVESLVPTPIDESISVRVFQNSEQVLEVLVPTTSVSDALEFVDTADFVGDRDRTDLVFDPETNLVTGSIFLQAGQFSLEPNATKYKVRQRGPQGTAGRDGSPLLEVVSEVITDPLFFTDQIILTLRKSSINDNLFYLPADVPKDLCVNRLKIETSSLPVSPFKDRHVVAVEQAIRDCKDIGFYRFDEEEDPIEFPELLLPAWTPIVRCADRKRYEISKFRWFDNLNLPTSPQPECFQAEVPFRIVTGDREPPEQCCKEDFFLCNNLGDACQITGAPTVNVPPQPEPSGPPATDFPSSPSSVSEISSSSPPVEEDTVGTTGTAGIPPPPESSSSGPPSPPPPSSSSGGEPPPSSSSGGEPPSSSSSGGEPPSSETPSSSSSDSDCCLATSIKVSNNLLTGILTKVVDSVPKVEQGTTDICFDEGRTHDKFDFRYMVKVTNNTAGPITVIGEASGASIDPDPVPLPLIPPCAGFLDSKQSLNSFVIQPGGVETTIILRWLWDQEFFDCCDYRITHRIICTGGASSASNSIVEIPSSPSPPDVGSNPDCCDDTDVEPKETIALNSGLLTISEFTSTNIDTELTSEVIYCQDDKDIQDTKVKLTINVKNDSSEFKQVKFGLKISSVASKQGKDCEVFPTPIETPTPIPLGPGDSFSTVLTYPIPGGLDDVFGFKKCCRYKISTFFRLEEESSSSISCCAGQNVIADSESFNTEGAGPTINGLTGFANDCVARTLDAGEFISAFNLCLDIDANTPAKASITFDVIFTIAMDSNSDFCPVVVTPTLRITDDDCLVDLVETGTDLCIGPGCSCDVTISVTATAKAGQSCCPFSPVLELDVVSCCDPARNQDARTGGCNIANTPNTTLTRDCQSTTPATVDLDHEHCVGTTCDGVIQQFHDRVEVIYGDACMTPTDCYCMLYDIDGTSSCISSLRIFNDCVALSGDVTVDDAVDITAIFCFSLTGGAGSSITFDMDIIWTADTMCDDPGCACTCHPTVDTVLTVSCFGCCCCPADEEPTDIVDGVTTIPLVGCEPGGTPPSGLYTLGLCSGIYEDSWDICVFGPGFHFRRYKFILRNDTTCEVFYDAKFTNNGLPFPSTGASGTLAVGATIALQDVGGIVEDTMEFFPPTAPALTCTCSDELGMCDIQTPLWQVEWTCDAACCDDSLVMSGDDKIVKFVGVTSTVDTTLDVIAIDSPTGTSVAIGSTNTLWSGDFTDKLYKHSGQFTTTLLDSEDVSGFEDPTDISTDGTDTLWSGFSSDKLYLQSGQFTSTVKDSEDVSATGSPVGVEWDGTNVMWCGFDGFDDKLFLQSGLFTSTVKDSEDVGGIDTPEGITGDAVGDTWFAGDFNVAAIKMSGKFTSTVLSSVDVSATFGGLRGISENTDTF